MRRPLAAIAALCLAGCNMPLGPVAPPATATDSFCSVYQRIIRSEAEGASLAPAERAVKERVAANDTSYRCICDRWTDPICEK